MHRSDNKTNSFARHEAHFSPKQPDSILEGLHLEGGSVAVIEEWFSVLNHLLYRHVPVPVAVANVMFI